MDALAFLDRADQATPQPVYVLTGDEGFLRRHVRLALQRLILGDDNDFGLSIHDGTTATYGAVAADVQTVALIGPRRLVIVENADTLITRERARLEKYVAAPSATGVLILEARTWMSSTRLAKSIPDAGTIVCKPLDTRSLPRWCSNWCKTAHGKELPADAAALLVDLIGPEMGRLDQEIEKLATAAGGNRRISAKDVDELVGRGRAEKTWDIFKLIAAGKVGPVLLYLDRLIEQGEVPLRLLGAYSLQLRRLVQAARLHETGQPLPKAIPAAGIPAFAVHEAEEQIKHLGRRRLDQIYDWLIQADVGMKSSNYLPERFILERLTIRLSLPRTANR